MRLLVCAAFAFSIFAQRPVTTIQNAIARVEMDRAGGSIVRFEFKANALNPLVWSNKGEGVEPRPMSHFLCLDRWGQPSSAELKNGMPFHGEATHVMWKDENSSADVARLSAELPMAGLGVMRIARIVPGAALLQVEESVTNRNKLGRPYNMVQHPTIGPPFLDATVVVDSNARRGFMQSSPMPNPDEPQVWWPQALKDGQPVDLRHLSSDPNPNVVSFAVDEEVGWVTAVNASKGLLLGYLWKTSDYPWLNIWRHVDDQGKPLARGLEFGTTGLHQPFQVLLKKGPIFNRPIVSWIEPGETHKRTYAAFLLRVPADFKGVANVSHKDGPIEVKERGGNRTLLVR
ncbi:MAG: hypothetical protein HYZ37_06350 [Candidatus Solibacter usitatus]|nr:hypothetical protein [Candidatus Solibacter usitatus]